LCFIVKKSCFYQ